MWEEGLRCGSRFDVKKIRVFEDQVGIPPDFFSVFSTSDDGFKV